ncbi:MAG: hypothetical protein EAZ89_12660 [Bacteroidetes bacterium]|nr:MAG: hypothetical protein EAZ89_12660 [Bacteroidota bacterium]
MISLDLFCWALAFLGFIMKLYNLPGAEAVLVLSLGLLATTYMLAPYLNRYRNIAEKILPGIYFHTDTAQSLISIYMFGVSAALVVVGSLTKLMLWPNSKFLLSLGAGALLLFLAVSFYWRSRSAITYNRRLATRGILNLVIAVGMLLLSDSRLADMYYSHDPDYARVVKRALLHPDDPEVRKQLEEARPKP